MATSAMLLIIQFARRRHLACHGLRPTLVTTRYIVLPAAPPMPSLFRVAAISDGFNDAGHASGVWWKWNWRLYQNAFLGGDGRR